MQAGPIKPSVASDAGKAPERVASTKQGTTLALTFADGRTQLIAAEHLRLACRCAHCTRARVDGVFPEAFDAIMIETVSPTGNYALNIGFSDGHARGVYPWGYLASLAESQTVS
jgi:prepilin-type processing-associated H-X9-DG protein